MLMSCKLPCMQVGERTLTETRGYHVTMLSDTTAGFTKAQKDAATDLIWPLFAHEVKKVGEWIATLEK